jgi:ABC-type phosphate transport system substrate-binding protein
MRRRRVPLQTMLVAITLVAVVAFAASCGGTSSTGDQTTPPVTTASGASAGTPISAADATAVRDVVLAYWAAYNAYDAEKTLSYLEEGYRSSQEKAIRGEIGQIKTFGVKLGVSEKSAPVLTASGQALMDLTLKEPTGTRTIVMKLTRNGDVWVISDVSEVK